MPKTQATHARMPISARRAGLPGLRRKSGNLYSSATTASTAHAGYTTVSMYAFLGAMPVGGPYRLAFVEVGSSLKAAPAGCGGCLPIGGPAWRLRGSLGHVRWTWPRDRIKRDRAESWAG